MTQSTPEFLVLYDKDSVRTWDALLTTAPPVRVKVRAPWFIETFPS